MSAEYFITYVIQLLAHPRFRVCQKTSILKEHIIIFITCGAKLLNADWLRQRAFFLNQEGTFGNQEGMIT